VKIAFENIYTQVAIIAYYVHMIRLVEHRVILLNTLEDFDQKLVSEATGENRDKFEM
jgi:hypothetical protein